MVTVAVAWLGVAAIAVICFLVLLMPWLPSEVGIFFAGARGTGDSVTPMHPLTVVIVGLAIMAGLALCTLTTAFIPSTKRFVYAFGVAMTTALLVAFVTSSVIMSSIAQLGRLEPTLETPELGWPVSLVSLACTVIAGISVFLLWRRLTLGTWRRSRT